MILWVDCNRLYRFITELLEEFSVLYLLCCEMFYIFLCILGHIAMSLVFFFFVRMVKIWLITRKGRGVYIYRTRILMLFFVII